MSMPLNASDPSGKFPVLIVLALLAATAAFAAGYTVTYVNTGGNVQASLAVGATAAVLAFVIVVTAGTGGSLLGTLSIVGNSTNATLTAGTIITVSIPAATTAANTIVAGATVCVATAAIVAAGGGGGNIADPCYAEYLLCSASPLANQFRFPGLVHDQSRCQECLLACKRDPLRVFRTRITRLGGGRVRCDYWNF